MMVLLLHIYKTDFYSEKNEKLNRNCKKIIMQIVKNKLYMKNIAKGSVLS